MSEDEAMKAAVALWGRYTTSGIGTTIGTTMIEHYSARFVVNDKKSELGLATGYTQHKDKWFGVEGSDAFHEMGGKENKDNNKYTKSADDKFPGTSATYELIFDKNQKLVTDSVNQGTFNFCRDGIDHAFLDMLPYWKMGNDPIDARTTNKLQRMIGVYWGKTPKGIWK
jgi:hypothetical protein